MDQYKINKFLTSGIRLGRIKGIEIRLHFLMLFFLLLSPFILNLPIPVALLYCVIVFGSVLLHELGHCYGAHLVGGYASQIVLWPLGGMAMVSGAERNPKAEFIVTLLGPAVSVALAALGWLAYRLTILVLPPSFFTDMLFVFAMVNMYLAAFNLLLPLFPMDCARILRSALSFYMHPNRVTYYLCTVGMFLGGAVALFGAASHMSILTCIGIFGAMESYQERMRSTLLPIYLEETYFYSYENAGLWSWIVSGLKSKFPKRSGRPKRAARVVNIERDTSTDGRRSNDPLENLQREMSEAVAREDFVEAARIRDRINKMK